MRYQVLAKCQNHLKSLNISEQEQEYPGQEQTEKEIDEYDIVKTSDSLKNVIKK